MEPNVPDEQSAIATSSQSEQVGAAAGYSVSGGFSRLLQKANLSLVFSSYQSGIVYCVGRNSSGGVHVHQTALPKPMGIARDSQGGLVIACEASIMRFQNVLAEGERANTLFDACYLPRTIHVTGRLDAHDVGTDSDGRPLFVNTRFNCLAAPAERHSFEEIWRPPFVSKLVDEDRCHLNGLAMEDGRPRYATAISRSDTVDGWRDRREAGGVVIDVETGEVVCDGLSMPHSPRLHEGMLWVLNSGTGDLGVVHLNVPDAGTFGPRVFCPGFTRGLVLHNGYAFVGLSKPRYKRFEGLALDRRLKDTDSEPWCGIQIIDLTKRSCVEWFRIDGRIGELYDLEILPGVNCPMAISPGTPEAAGLITFDKHPEPVAQVVEADATTASPVPA